jgi:hypothetical protein
MKFRLVYFLALSLDYEQKPNDRRPLRTAETMPRVILEYSGGWGSSIARRVRVVVMSPCKILIVLLVVLRLSSRETTCRAYSVLLVQIISTSFCRSIINFHSPWYSSMSPSIVRIADGSAVMAAAWAALRKRAEVIWANLSDGPEAGVIIIPDAGCIGIMGKL